MVRITLLIVSAFIFSVNTAIGQSDQVLFTVNDHDVTVSEFDYIYNKNNGEEADYSKESLEEYLDLYTKFKLKVEKAKDMGLDTVKRLQNELEGYRKQLASSYLVDKEVSEKLIDEVIERSATDVEVSHIFVASPSSSSIQKREAALEKINTIYGELERGKSFSEMAKKFSEDKRSAIKGGALGFYVAMLPAGFYEFENAMYTTPIGEYSKPIKSKLGHHIIKVTSKRPARGQMEVSHILIKKAQKPSTAKIDSLYKELEKGKDFGKLATEYSEDPNTNTKAGYLGFFGINKFDKAFEDAAFKLKSDGDYSSPVETQFGYHIIKRHSMKVEDDLAKRRRKIQGSITKDERFAAAKKGLVKKIIEEVDLQQNKLALAKFTSTLDEEFYSYKWKVPENIEDIDLLKIGDDYTKKLRDFAEYCKKDTKSRLRYNKSTPLDESVNDLYERYLDERMLAYEESNLANKYPEFKSLMREYEEGILLFEATKMEVWDKASQDTVGLEKFYMENKDNYMWGERLEVEDVVINTDDKKELAKILKKVKKSDVASLMNSYNKDGNEVISVETRIVQKESKDADKLPWGKVGAITDVQSKDAVHTFTKVKRVIPNTNKTLKEARGYIIADYQDLLEKNWIVELKKSFKVDLNEDVFNSLIKK